ncbi:bZIP transcription factor family protein [Striga asiatica]|uniref:BZIP transcription factor family protein n=1 Tax=Striga asiatica TaxID=4170 RepID=A0A5A7QSV4_STRAF|nr:bZIP transcription factor family protein [Striga asiatica]
MRRTASQLMLKHLQEVEEEDDEKLLKVEGQPIRDVNCMKPNMPEPRKPYESLSCEKYGSWRQEQRRGAEKLKKQLKARWAIQKLIDEIMGRFQAHNNRAMLPTKMTDVAQLLMPKWIPAHELAALCWLGDWRPSTILELLRSLAHSLWDPASVERDLAQLINDIRIEEAVIDEEMTEIQSNCVLHLPFGPSRSRPALACVRSEFKKIHRVIVKAQNLRMKALELAVKKVLSQADAAEFLVAFVEIQDAVHDFSTKLKTRNGGVRIKELGVHSPSCS